MIDINSIIDTVCYNFIKEYKMKNLLSFLLIVGSFFSITGVSAEKELPKVLIIGDSISLAYTPIVIKILTADAKVIHHKGNAGPTLRGLKDIDKWIGKTKWDIIHFNWGLWDMYRWRYEKEDQSPEAYEKNLEILVTRLKKAGAKLIWGTTTPACPEGEKKIQIKVSPELEAKYQSAALRVMKKHNIQVNDLYSFMKPKMKDYSIAPNDVHFNKAGSKALAEQVAAAIKKELK
jgi:hypothetical protein